MMFSELDRLLPPEPMRRLLSEGGDLLDTDPTELLALADEALEACKTSGDRPGELHASFWRAQALRYVGDCAKAVETLRSAWDLAVRTVDRESMVMILLGFGRISTATGMYEAALSALSKAASLGRDTLPEDHPALLDIERGICMVRSKLGQHQEVVTEYLALADRYQIRGLVRDAVYCINNAGNNAARMMDFDKALLYYARAEKLLMRQGSWPLLRAVLRANRATPLIALGRHEEAHCDLLQSLPVLHMAGHRLCETDTRLKLAKLHFEMGDEEEGEQLLTRALAIATDSGFTPERIEIHEELAAHFIRRQDFGAALRHTESAISLRADLSKREAHGRIERERMLNELEQALRSDDAERQRNSGLAAEMRVKQLGDALAELLDEQSRLLDLLRLEKTQTDTLTGVADRWFIDVKLHDELQRAERYGRSLSLLGVEIDHLPQINEHYTPSVGDAVLRALASLLGSLLRQNDLVGRYRKDEFLILLPETLTDDAIAVAEKLRSAVSSHDWAAVAPGLEVTVSVGMAEHINRETLEEWLLRIDQALQTAREAGRNRVVRG